MAPETAASILDCPGEGNGCRCACHGCKFHCSAHDPTRLWDEPTTTAAAVRCVCGAGCDFAVPEGWVPTPPAQQVTCMGWPRGQEPEWFRRLAGGRYV